MLFLFVRTLPVFSSPVNDPGIVDTLQPILEKHHVPAIAGAIVTADGPAVMGAVGVRKMGTNIAATVDDLWHLGSNTKAMTATAVALLVEQGNLTWETTLADVFPELAPRMRPAFTNVTVRQLLSHRAGLPPNLDWSALAKKGTVHEQRLRALRLATAEEPAFEIGGKFHYSNLGYVIVGAMMDKVTGRSWEETMREQLFAPLKMTSAGFGGTGTRGKIDQPWPHTAGAKPTAQNGPSVDNPAVISPGGRVHCTLADWSKFIADQLLGARGEAALLKPESYAALHAPAGSNDYALGWGVTRRGWGGGTVLTHSGCNTMNYSVAWLSPKRNFAVLVCINQGDDVAAKAADEAAAALIGLWQRGAVSTR